MTCHDHTGLWRIITDYSGAGRQGALKKSPPNECPAGFVIDLLSGSGRVRLRIACGFTAAILRLAALADGRHRGGRAGIFGAKVRTGRRFAVKKIGDLAAGQRLSFLHSRPYLRVFYFLAQL